MGAFDSLKLGKTPFPTDQFAPLGYMPPQYASQFAATGLPPGAGEGFGGGTPRRPSPAPLAPVPSGVPLLGQPGSGTDSGVAPSDDKTKQGPPQRGGIGGFFSRVGHGLHEMAQSGELQMRLALSQAALNGDTGAAAQLSEHLSALHTQQAQTRAAAATRQSLANNMMKHGMDAGDVELALTNPEAFGTEYNTRFRTRDGAPGTTISTPNLSGAPTLQQFPTAAEQAARAINLQPGTPAFDTFIRDFTLNSNGPTGTATTIRGQNITRQNNVDDNATSRSNNATTNSTSRANNSATIGGENFRHTTPGAGTVQPPTPDRVIGQIMAAQAAGQPITPTQQALLSRYQAGRGRAAGRIGAGGAPVPVPGRIATNPQGVRIQQMSNGAWIPVR